MRPGSSEYWGLTGICNVPSISDAAPRLGLGWSSRAFLLCSLCTSSPTRDIILESIPTDNPGAHSNLYILTGHQSSY